MNKEQYIEEMAQVVASLREDYMDEISMCRVYEALYDAGYRKQTEGEWEKLDNDHFNCTHCGQIFALGSTATIYNVKRNWKFCPNCGAKMKGGE